MGFEGQSGRIARLAPVVMERHEKVMESLPTWTIATIVGAIVSLYQSRSQFAGVTNSFSVAGSQSFASPSQPSREMPVSPETNRPYRRTVFAAFATVSLTLASAAMAQEILPLPPSSVDPHATDPFVDDPNGSLASWSITPKTLDRLHEPLLRRDLKITSAQSCAASNCHGGPRPGIVQPWARRGAAFQLWKENDPHAQSWRTICGDESVAIMKRLKILDDEDRIVDKKGFDNCLACHNTTQRYDEPRTHTRIQEGVGCGACHGPSEGWINTHFQQHWSPESAAHDGFVNAGNLYTRARMCASCHVGDKDRDMNHDIIAAGHPSLKYELATFHAWQPKHWRDPESRDKKYYESQLWLAGQIASADASLALLESRATDAHTVSEWPEFAAYDCASCHHNLGLDNDRSPNPSATASYSTWNDAGLRWLLNYRVQSGSATDEDAELMGSLETVAALMQTRPRPDAANVASAAAEARRKLVGWFDGQAGSTEKHIFNSDRLGQVVASAAGNPETFATWESAVQFYLATVAARESWPGGWKGDLRGVSDRMQRGLAYPAMIDVSRFAKRETASGPPANRNQITQLGIEMAGWLGPVSVIPYRTEELPQYDAAKVDMLLKEIEDRWKANPPKVKIPERTAPKEVVPEPKPEDQDPQKILDDLKDSIFD